jgi:hypothetical protein
MAQRTLRRQAILFPDEMTLNVVQGSREDWLPNQLVKSAVR